MKQIGFVALVLAVVAVSALGFEINHVRQPRSLEEDLNDFYLLLPIDEIVNLALDYFINDDEVQNAFAYMHDEEFKTIWMQLVSNKAIRDVVRCLQEAGLNVVGTLNDFANIFGLQHFPELFQLDDTNHRTGGLNGLLQDVIALLPLDKLKELFEDKMKTSPEFEALVARLRSVDFKDFLNFVHNSQELQSLFQKLRDRGIDLGQLVKLIRKFFDWQ